MEKIPCPRADGGVRRGLRGGRADRRRCSIPEVLVEALEEELLEIARLLDEGGSLPVTGKETVPNEAALKEAADTFLTTISPRER